MTLYTYSTAGALTLLVDGSMVENTAVVPVLFATTTTTTTTILLLLVTRV